MATTFLEPGGDADFGTGLWKSLHNTPTIVSDFVHGGHQRSIKYAPGATAQQTLTPIGVLADAGTRFNAWLYINALPSSVGVPFLFNDISANNVIAFTITTGGVIQLTDNNSVQMGSNGATLATGQWYRITVTYVITSSTVNVIKVFVNGTLSITVTNYTLPVTTSTQLVIGNSSGDTAFDIRVSDVYVDSSSANTDPGNIWVTAKRPIANGTTNGFTTQIGSGGSGYPASGGGHSPQVNERPNNDANGWSIASAGSAITEEYNIESVSQGDIDITGATIVDYTGWIRSKALASETGKIIINNVSSNISLTSTIQFFTKIAGSATYPAGTGSDIGEITSTTVTTISLYECGVVVAYIPAVVANNASLGYKSLLGVGL